MSWFKPVELDEPDKMGRGDCFVHGSALISTSRAGWVSLALNNAQQLQLLNQEVELQKARRERKKQATSSRPNFYLSPWLLLFPPFPTPFFESARRVTARNLRPRNKAQVCLPVWRQHVLLLGERGWAGKKQTSQAPLVTQSSVANRQAPFLERKASFSLPPSPGNSTPSRI